MRAGIQKGLCSHHCDMGYRLNSGSAELPPREGYPSLVGSEMPHSSFFSGMKNSVINSLREGEEKADLSKNILEEEM